MATRDVFCYSILDQAESQVPLQNFKKASDNVIDYRLKQKVILEHWQLTCQFPTRWSPDHAQLIHLRVCNTGEHLKLTFSQNDRTSTLKKVRCTMPNGGKLQTDGKSKSSDCNRDLSQKLRLESLSLCYLLI